jgi:PncC family amidohydrolase
MTDQAIEAKLGELLRQKGLKLATAESCTGGMIGDRITNAPGSSDYFLGGVISYAYEAKVKLLGVSWDTLRAFGAVSQETALEMARGARLALDADIGVSVTGIAGPGGGLPHKPVGTIWIGLSAPGIEQAWSFHFDGDRLKIKEQASEQALQLVIKYLKVGAGIAV